MILGLIQLIFARPLAQISKPRFSMFEIDMKVHISDICGLASFHPYFEQKGIMFKYTISYKQKHPNANR